MAPECLPYTESAPLQSASLPIEAATLVALATLQQSTADLPQHVLPGGGLGWVRM